MLGAGVRLQSGVRRGVTACLPLPALAGRRHAGTLQLGEKDVEKQTFPRVAKGYWEEAENRREFVERVAKANGVRELQDWRRVTNRHVAAMGGGSLLTRFSGSWYAVLQDAYPNRHMPEPLCRPQVSSGYWQSKENREAFLQHVAEELGLQDESQWSRIPRRELIRLGGGGLLASYRNSVAAVVDSVVKESDGNTRQTRTEDLRRHVSREMSGASEDRREAGSECDSVGGRDLSRITQTHWSSIDNCKEFLRQLARRKQVEEERQWAGVSARDVLKAGGGGLLARCGGSWASVLRDVVDVRCEPTQSLPASFWEEEEHQREFVAGLLERSQAAREDGVAWEILNRRSMIAAGGEKFLQQYGGSAAQLLVTLFPGSKQEIEAAASSSPNVHGRQWVDDTDGKRSFLKFAASELGLRTTEEWKRVSHEQLRKVPGGGAFLQKHKLLDSLQEAYPDTDWSGGELTRVGKKAAQRHLFLRIRQLLPNVLLEEDFRGEDMRRSHTGSPLELDIFLPEQKIALCVPCRPSPASSFIERLTFGSEYQGAHHYEEVPLFGPLDVIQRRDEAKREMAERQNIRLVEVPFWWDGERTSLAATLEAAVPGFLQTHCSDGNLVREVLAGRHEPVPSYEQWWREREGRRRTSSKRAVKGRKVWSLDGDPTGYWMVEKPKGAEVWWTSDRQLVDGRGRVMAEDERWASGMPQGLAGDVVGVMVKDGGSDAYRKKFLAVDVRCHDPTVTFSDRVAMLRAVKSSSSWAVADYRECAGREELAVLLAEGSDILLRQGDDEWGGDVYVARTVETTTATVVRKSLTSRGVVVAVQSEAGTVEQTAKCSLSQYQHLPAPGTEVTVSHSGTWATGRLKYPQLASVPHVASA